MILDGRKVQDIIVERMKPVIADKYLNNVIIVVGDNPASNTYIKNKVDVCKRAGISTEIIRYADIDVPEEDVLELINTLNNDESVTGILVQLPLPKHINEDTIAKAIAPEKDLDCFNPINIGNMFLGNMNPGEDILPATPLGIVTMLNHYNIDIAGKDVTIVGCSNIVGKPLSTMLTNLGATVTVCHSKTKDLKAITKKADITILAVGKAQMFDSNWFKKYSTVIDVGINMVDGKLCGDFDKYKHPYHTQKVKTIFGLDLKFTRDLGLNITPVPNGVGRTTVAALIYNTMACYNKQHKA